DFIDLRQEIYFVDTPQGCDHCILTRQLAGHRHTGRAAADSESPLRLFSPSKHLASYERDAHAGHSDFIFGRLCARLWHRICLARANISSPPPRGTNRSLERTVNSASSRRSVRIRDLDPAFLPQRNL